MDIWEANGRSEQLAPHACNQTGLYRCTGDECAFNGVCDKNGCGQNPYVLGNKNFYGTGKNFKVDTSRPFTVVTQFPTDNTGKLKQINRLYVQDGRVIQNPTVNITYSGPQGINYINSGYCNATGAARFQDLGGLTEMGEALGRGMVLAMSIWWDAGGFMNWLDSGNAGPCNATEGDPNVIQKVQSNLNVRFSEIKWGEIGSTFTAGQHKGY
jgi:cellulase